MSFIIAGDLNARVSDFLDYIPEDNVDCIFNKDVDYPGDTFCLPRKSRNTEYNNFGLSLIELCCTRDIHILNGRYSDSYGSYTHAHRQ